MSDENQTGQERTEAPTPRRRERAREEGQIPRSQELSGAAVLLAGCAALAFGATVPIAGYLRSLVTGSAASLSAGVGSAGAALDAGRFALGGFVLALAPLLAVITGVSLLVNGIQARGTITMKPLQPQLSRLSPIAGFKRLVAPEAFFSLLKAILKFGIVAAAAGLVLAHHATEIGTLSLHGAPDIAAVLRSLVFKLVFAAGLAYLLVAGLDYGFQVFQHEKRLRMTRQELVQEHRETEGDPHLKGRLMAVARALARRRMLHQVPTADVVVTNPTHIAVALRYDLEAAAAPMVVAMGERKLAERIKAIAVGAGVPVVENKPVARALLATSTVGQPIAPALYAAIAEILAFVYRQRRALGLLEAAVEAARRRR